MSTLQVDVDASDALISDFSSRMMPHLRSFPNTIPTTELQNLSHLISAKNNNVEEEIRKHEFALIALKSKRKALEGYSAACRSLLNPIRRLPVEILREIFTHLGGVILLEPGFMYCPALKLAAICGAWRDLALSTSELWSRIKVSIGVNRTQNLELHGFLDLMNMALECSRNAPLDIDFSVERSLPRKLFPAVSPILQSIAHHSYHWCRIIIEFRNLEGEGEEDLEVLRGYSDVLWNASNRKFPLLESLSISNTPQGLPVNMIAPKLCFLALRGFTTPLATLKLPWDQLSTLTVDGGYLSIPDILAVVNLCPNIRRFHICFAGSPMAVTPTEVIHNMHSLEILEFVRDDIQPFTEAALRSLTLPQLSQLHLLGISWTYENEHLVKTFLQRSSCTITLLRLQGRISNTQLVSLFRLLPSIEELYVAQDPNWGEDNADVLMTSLHFLPHSQPFSQPLLPKLQKIEFRWLYNETPSYETIIGFVKSRWLPDLAYDSDMQVNCLKSVSFHFNWSYYDFSPLMCLRDAGLELTITGCKKKYS